MEIRIDTTQPVESWSRSIPSEIDVLVGHITTSLPKQKFNFNRFFNKPGQKYYQSPISVNSLLNMNGYMVGYLINYKGYEIQVNELLHEICIIK